MEFRQLRYFVAAAEEGSISRAARKVFLTQPALSRQIKALEEELGVCLLERRAHSIHLTVPGEAMVGEARELLRRAEEVLSRVRAAGLGLPIRVGYAPSLAAGLLSRAVEGFARLHPDLRVEWLDLSTQEMLAGLDARKIEVAVTVGEQPSAKGLHWTPLLRVPWSLAVHADHPLARRARISPAEVARERLLVFCRRDYPEYWKQVLGWFRAHRQSPAIAGEYDGATSLLAAVAAGQGVALVALRKAARVVPPRVGLKRLAPAPEPLCVAAAQRADSLPDKLLAGFVQELRRAAAEMGPPS